MSGAVGTALTGLLGTVLALGFVLALAYVALRLLRRFQDRATGASPGSTGPAMRFLRALPVGARERVVVIEVDGERLLIGVSAASVTLLTRLAPRASDNDGPARVSTASLLARLPRLPARTATLQTALLAALDCIKADDVVVSAAVSDRSPEGGWIAFDSDPGRILLRLSAPGALAAAEALRQYEPLISAIEAALGLELMPTGMVERPAPDAVIIALAYGQKRAWLAVSPTLRIDPPRRFLRPSLDQLGMPVTVRLSGARLTPTDHAALASGDMLLIPADAPVTLTASLCTAHGRLTTAPARMRVLSVGHPHAETMMTLDQPADAQAPPSGLLADHPIPITVELANVTVPLAVLSGLAPGSVLPLGLTGQSLPVRLTVGDRTIATGELVAVGEGYGVLIDKRAD